jgi:hypothetical protein|tara:strand:+ start:3804 stop:4073 length:270 start_codon:yes stop_codon:yes gene_type:complete
MEDEEKKDQISKMEDAIWSVLLSIILVVSIIQEVFNVTIIACYLMALLKFNVWRSRWPEENDRRSLFYAIAYVLCGTTYLVMLLHYGVL